MDGNLLERCRTLTSQVVVSRAFSFRDNRILTAAEGARYNRANLGAASPSPIMLSSVHRLLRFGVYEMNLDTQELRNAGTLVKLAPQPFRLLEMLASHAGQIVTREEIQNELWGNDTYVDFDRGVHKCVNQIRNVLNDNPERPLYVATLPRKGYRFLAPVTSKTVVVTPKVRESEPADPPTDAELAVDAVAASSGAGAAATLQPETAATPSSAPAPPSPRRRTRLLLTVALVALAGFAILFYWQAQKAHALMERDTVVLADFANSTGEPVFDETLKQALRIQLEQSPLLNLVSDQKVNSTLRLTGHSPGDRLTPELTRDICQRVGSKAMLTGSIAQLGSQYVIGVQAVNCTTGDVLAEALEQAKNKEEVLKAVDRAAVSVRRKLGESLRSVQTFATPVEEATTPSLEALRAYSLGVKASREEGWAAALPYYQHAIELDPNFAVAYFELGISYNDQSEPGRAREYLTKAFELREHTSERERLAISGVYYHLITGELDKATRVSTQMTMDYPQKFSGYEALSLDYGSMGEYEQAVPIARQASVLPPDRVGEYDNLVNFLLASQQLEQAQNSILEAQKKKLGTYYSHAQLYALGFLRGDAARMAEQQHWFESKPALENFGLSLTSDTEAYHGHLRKARTLSQQAAESAVRSDSKEGGATWSVNQALREAAFGNLAAAEQAADAGLALAPNSLSVQAEAALAYAMAGNRPRAESMARDLNANYPLDTQVQSLWLPAIQAQLALDRKKPAEAIQQLQPASPPLENGASPSILQVTCLYPTYIRGQAYLQSGQGAAAAAEFQKILSHSGMVWNCWTGALAQLGLARANALQSAVSQGADAEAARAHALTAYSDFLKLWTDADSDIPIYQQAKAEYRKLAGNSN